MNNLGRFLVAAVCVGAVSLSLAGSARATSFAVGDVFVSVRNTVVEYTPSGTLVQTLNDLDGNFDSGATFDAAGNLYITNFFGGNVSKFNANGTLAATTWATNAVQPVPESVIFDAANGSFFAGGAFVGTISQYDSAGAIVRTYFVSNTGTTGGTDWVTLQNANTLLYLGEGTQMDSLNLTTGVSSLFGAALPTNSFEVKVIPSGAFAGDILVAGSTAAYLLSGDGITVLKTYTLPGNDGTDFSIDIDPNGLDFWTSDNGGEVWEVNIATGAIIQQWSTGSGSSTTFGLAVFGEPSTVTATPEPGSLVLLGSGCFAIAAALRRKLFAKRTN